MQLGLEGEGGILLSLSLLLSSISTSPFFSSPITCLLLVELQAVAAVADLEEEPLQRRAAHPR